MLFEDEPLVAIFVEEALNDAGFEVILARNPDEAEAAIRDSIDTVSALVSDIRLGEGLSGWELARLARERSAGLPVVFISGDSGIDHTAQGVPDSVMIQKPFVEAQLITALASLLNDRAAAP
ncbi:response regulator [Novosphingobium sp. Gsoil 351]|uniref:response regulator n=1 Tax=Novosphingobium sp. Gsoil 351 TaxID=2675225 RepID=UPI001E4E5475|nr:response regulator [Novosphingobium sp. Gsoil 351]